MVVDNKKNFVVIDKQASSLYSLIADGQYRATSLGRDAWKSLIGAQASLQLKCGKEGFNVLSGHIPHSKARIGILGNQENNCDSCDSRIGFGTGGHHDDSNTCGNEATYQADNGNKHIKAMGYILVQWGMKLTSATEVNCTVTKALKHKIEDKDYCNKGFKSWG